MLRWAVITCLTVSPFFTNCAPQSAHPSRYETEQDYTDSPDAKLVSQYPEIQTEKTAAAKQSVKPHKPTRARFQQQYPNQQPQYPSQQPQYPSQQPQYPNQQPQYPSQEQYQQYQTDYRASTQQPQTSHPAAQYEQPQDQYQQPQYINQAKYAQQTAHHEHRPTTTPFIPIIRQEKNQALDGTYQQSWETGNNIIASENGYFKHISEDQDALVQTGNYTYTAPDGSVVWTSYTADEGGFKVSGSHLPTPPPIPEEIRKGLEQIYEGIRLQQEAEAREAKTGKKKPVLGEDNSINAENYPQPDNYPPQYRYHQQQQQQQQQQQPQQYRSQSPPPQQQQQYRQSPQQQSQQTQEQPQTFRPIVAQPHRRVQKVQRPQSQQYQPAPTISQQFQESQRIQENEQPSEPQQYEQQ